MRRRILLAVAALGALASALAAASSGRLDLGLSFGALAAALAVGARDR